MRDTASEILNDVIAVLKCMMSTISKSIKLNFIKYWSNVRIARNKFQRIKFKNIKNNVGPNSFNAFIVTSKSLKLFTKVTL